MMHRKDWMGLEINITRTSDDLLLSPLSILRMKAMNAITSVCDYRFI